MVTPQSLKEKRIAAGLTGRLVAPRAGLACNRLSDIERGYATATPDELARISRAVERLSDARKQLRELAVRIGWPADAI